MPTIVVNKPGVPQLEPNSWEASLLGSIGSTHIRHRRVCAKSTNLHKHPDADEAFFMLRGEMVLEVEGKSYTLRSGDFAMVKAGEEHRTIVPDMVELIVIDNIE